MASKMSMQVWLVQLVKTVALVTLSALFLPLSTVLLFGTTVLSWFRGSSYKKVLPDEKRRTVLVTGVGMAKGLFLARAFAKAGHRVIGADFEPYGIPCSGRFSKAISRFYRLTTPQGHDFVDEYVNSLQNIVEAEDVDMWISCSGVCTAVEDGLARDAIERETSCLCAQIETSLLKILHMKDEFEAYTASLGLKSFTPESSTMTSKAAVFDRMQDEPDQTFFIKVIDPDIRRPMKPFSLKAKQEAYAYINALDISKAQPYQMQKFVSGGEYCTHALMVRGEVKAFTACESCDLVRHYKALPSDSPLTEAMLNFTKQFAEKSPHREQFTGHFSLDFLIEESVTETGTATQLYVIECNPRAHTAVVLFEDVSDAVVAAYLELLEPGSSSSTVVQSRKTDGFYWVGWDLVSLVLVPFLEILVGRISPGNLIKSVGLFIDHLLFWEEATFDIADPLPFWMLYHLHWPGYLVALLADGKQWTRLNVSTMRYWLGEHTG